MLSHADTQDHSESGKKAPVFYILCGNAAYNRGDRGNLYSQLALLRSHFPDATLVLDSSRHETDSQWYDAIVLKRTILPCKQQRHWLRRADIVIIGGGALFADNSCRLLVPYWCMLTVYVRKILRKPVMVWANGLVLDTLAGRFFARLALNMVQTITVRDRGSFQLCRDMKLIPAYEETADPAVLLSPGDKSEGEALLRAEGITLDKPVFCISPTFWHIYHTHRSWLPYPMGKRFSRTLSQNSQLLEQYKQSIARLAHALATQHGARIVLMPRYASPQWDDVAYCESIVSAANLPGNIHILSNDTYPPRQFFAVWKCFALNISVAMHDAIFATVMDCPVLHLYYETKGQDFFTRIGATENLMNWEELLSDDGISRICDRAGKILKDWEPRRQQRLQALLAIQDKARRNVDILKSLYRQIVRQRL